MANVTASSEKSLVSLLRKRLSDVRHNRVAFTFALVDQSASDGEIEIKYGNLRTNITNSVQADDLLINLSDLGVDTVGGLVDFLKTKPGYALTEDRQIDREHPSIDLAVIGFGDFGRRSPVTVAHRRWSDSELLGLIAEGVQRHNISYTPATVPENEFQFVLNLANALALRQLANNAVKRQGLDSTVEDLIKLAESYERAYKDDRKRQERAIPVPTIRDDDVGEGDIVQGEMFRRSGRTGFVSPMSANLPPEPPEFFEPLDEDIRDTSIRLRWKRPRDYDFYAVEVWRDTKEDVRRSRSGTLARNPTALTREAQAVTTSKLVFQTFGANSNFDSVSFATFLEEFGQLITSFIDGVDSTTIRSGVKALPLEPETSYYYRLYIVDLNYEIVDSQTIRATTKRMRARADETTPLDVVQGPLGGGTAVTMTGTRFHDGMQVKLGDKLVNNLAVVNPTTATFTSPEYINDQIVNSQLDLVIISDTGLEDILPQRWKVLPA